MIRPRRPQATVACHGWVVVMADTVWKMTVIGAMVIWSHKKSQYVPVTHRWVHDVLDSASGLWNKECWKLEKDGKKKHVKRFRLALACSLGGFHHMHLSHCVSEHATRQERSFARFPSRTKESTVVAKKVKPLPASVCVPAWPWLCQLWPGTQLMWFMCLHKIHVTYVSIYVTLDVTLAELERIPSKSHLDLRYATLKKNVWTRYIYNLAILGSTGCPFWPFCQLRPFLAKICQDLPSRSEKNPWHHVLSLTSTYGSLANVFLGVMLPCCDAELGILSDTAARGCELHRFRF